MGALLPHGLPLRAPFPGSTLPIESGLAKEGERQQVKACLVQLLCELLVRSV